MDGRWRPYDIDSKRDTRIVLYSTASVGEVRDGTAVGVDISEFVSRASHTFFDCTLTLNWNRELFGADAQPRPNQILEIQLWQSEEFKTVWIGIVDNISAYTVIRGERSMQLVARSRDSLDIFKTTKRVTKLYPQMTNFAYIVEEIAKSAGLGYDEIVLPTSAYTTAHTNTQLAEMSAWEMITDIFLPMGWTPFIDGLGRLRAADRNLSRAFPIVLSDDRVVKVVAQRQRPPATRLRVKWLNPILKKSLQQARVLREETITIGWFMPWLNKDVYFSDDKTQRAVDTYLKITHSANSLWVPFVTEEYKPKTENMGQIQLKNYYISTAAVSALIYSWWASHNVPDGVAGVVTVPTGRRLEAISQLAFCMMLLAVGTGVYEIWGTPYEWVHARNTTEAFDVNAPKWADNPVEVETDFIVDEPHAQAVAVRELIYQAKSANKWTAQVVDDPRIEFGDVLEFFDGSRMYVEDITRDVSRGSESVLEVSGFLIGGSASMSALIPTPIAPPEPDPVIPPIPPPTPGPTPTGPQAPNMLSTLQSVLASRTWRMAEIYEDEPDGRGAFTGAVVDALHAIDSAWGHVRKSGGQNQYQGHAVDAINWKRPDGVTAEIYDIVSGGGDVYWGYAGGNNGTAATRESWYY